MTPRLDQNDTEIFIDGEYYTTILSSLHQLLQPSTYLEVGTLHGTTLKLAHCASIAVDPTFQLDQEVVGKKPYCGFYQVTSDDFFAQFDPHKQLGRAIDLAFLDGLHVFSNLLRDFASCERICRAESVIVLHDCIPRDSHMTRPFEQMAVQRPTTYPGYWTEHSSPFWGIGNRAGA